MANFYQVNKEIKKMYPDLDIEVVRGEGYVYFSGDFAYEHHIESIMTHPVSTSTHDVIQMAISEINEYLK